MSRALWHQDRRMQKFKGVLDRWERRELSQCEAAELLGCSERQFRRYRDRWEDEGEAGLEDKRLGKASGKAIARRRLSGCWSFTGGAMGAGT
jgi:hypothetical protein